MVKIPQRALKCVAYMYEEEDAARHGLEFGGTAFLMAFPSEKLPAPMAFQYVVTNWHVAVRDKINVVRVNRRDGEPHIMKIENWYYDDRFDIAVAPFPANNNILDISFIHPNLIITPQIVTEQQLTPGEDVFMVGRFVDHDGGKTNKPAVRFGNISVMPTPLEQPNGAFADSYCLDMHSRPGYSGSPVFVFRTPGYDLEEQLESGSGMKLLVSGVNLFGFLGIHYDQFPEPWPIVGTFKGEVRPIEHDGPIIRGLSGMTKVLPAWSIMEVLSLPILKAMREEIEGQEWVKIVMKSQGEGPKKDASNGK